METGIIKPTVNRERQFRKRECHIYTTTGNVIRKPSNFMEQWKMRMEHISSENPVNGLEEIRIDVHVYDEYDEYETRYMQDDISNINFIGIYTTPETDEEMNLRIKEEEALVKSYEELEKQIGEDTEKALAIEKLADSLNLDDLKALVRYRERKEKNLSKYNEE